jgi:phosphomannomutase/phosphoglucomutase
MLSGPARSIRPGPSPYAGASLAGRERTYLSRGSPRPPVRLFGTNGIREVVGQKMTAPFVVQVSGAIARVVPVGKPIAVGRDGRTSSEAFAQIAASTLALAGHTVIDLGLLPTPAIQYNVRAVGAQMAVVVTASHNPPEFNGIKCIAEDGLEVERFVEEAIEKEVAAGAVASAPFDRVGELRSDRVGAQRYVEGILGRVDVPSVSKRRFTVVLDCGNGASVPTSPQLLRRLGCRVITLNGQVDGTFPGHLSEPTEAHLADLAHTVPAVGADLGIAHDGDADRAVFIDEKGRYIPGEKTLTLLARDTVHRHGGGIVVTPVTSSQSVEDVVRAEHGEIVYTKVGSPTVTHEMMRRKAVFGGEENGGLIFPGFQLARDGAMTAAAMLDLLARSGRSLGELVDGLPEYFLVKQKVACPSELRSTVLAALKDQLAAGSEKVITLDGVKAYRGNGWVLLRPSGTEPLIRVFAEAKDAQEANALAREVLVRVERTLAELAPPPVQR